MMNIAVFGSGSWATAIVKILCETHEKVFWWVREKEIEEGVKEFGHNPLFLRYCELKKEKIEVSNDINYILSSADYLFFVIPAAFLEVSLKDVKKESFKDKKIISAIKGIVPSTNQIVSDYFRAAYDIPFTRQAVISGPSHAEEIAQECLTYLTVGSEDQELASLISKNINCRFVKTVLSDDIEGIEYGAVLKNIYALASGIARGVGYGDNFIAVLISNSVQEMERFLSVVAPRERDTKRLVYLGDLLVTAYSQHSRNRTFGQMIGKGYSVISAQLEMAMVAEGYYSAQSINETNKYFKVKMPIAEAVYNILYKGQSAHKEFEILSEHFI
jgi:glycerol-3-phosphate dehydrogenase (NAD(P)+)